MSQTHNFNFFGKCMARLGSESIKREPSNEAKPWIMNIQRSTVRQPESERNKWFAIQFVGKCFGVHMGIIPYFDWLIQSDEISL